MAAFPGLRQIGLWDADEGDISDLLSVFGGLDSGRMILLGAAGGGKTSAAILLLLDVLEHRSHLEVQSERSQIPVPVILPLNDWDVTRQSLSTWASARLELDYPFLLATGRGTANALIHEGRVALLLDGLDDLPEQLRSVALRALDEQAGVRLVLLSRSRALLHAVEVGGHFAGAATLELQPVTPAQAAAYLERCRVDPPPPGWHRLTKTLA